MKAQDLKKSILQYAMEGKLVAQDPTDEPASELLKRIRAEKEQLIKDGKIKKEKPLPSITRDEIPYDLPQGWEWVRLYDLCSILGDGIHGTPIYTPNTEYYFVNGNNLNNGVIEIKPSTKTVSKEEYEKYKKKLNEKTVLVSINGTLGNIAFYHGEKIMLGKSACYFNLLTGINKLYIKLLLDSDYFSKYAEFIATGTTIKNVSLKSMKEFLIPLPPLSEQKRIVEKLEEILPLVEDYGKNEEILSEMNQKLPKQIRQSILQYAVQGKLVEQDPTDEPASELLKRIRAEKEQLIKDGKIKKEKPLPPITQDEIPYELPQGWEWVRLGEVINYGSTGTVDNNNNLDENTWILDLEDIEKESSKLLVKNIIKNKSFNSSKKNFKKGDVLYGKLRPYLDKVIVAEEDGICTTEILPLRIYYGIDSYYLKWFLKSPMFIQYVNQLTYGVKMPRLGTEDGKNALLALPPLAEQKRIVTKVEELMQLVDKLENI